MKIVVLAGGLSPERDVSLSSGSLIANALLEKGHHVVLIDAYKGIEKIEKSIFLNSQSNQRYQFIVPKQEPDLQALIDECNHPGTLLGENVIDVCLMADLVFIALHGDIGENGKIQAVFDIYGITYTGTGYQGSLLAMDKDLSKQLMIQHQIPTPKWKFITVQKDTINEIMQNITYPFVLKPCSCGSSVGVSIIETKEQFETSLHNTIKYESNILLEELIKGREFSVGVLNNKVLPVIEIIPKDTFYDYKNKYQVDGATEVCPANLSKELTLEVQEYALKVHKVLRLGSYARIDFMLNENQEWFCLEANTLPGMTPTSLLPQEAKANNIEYTELCEQIALLAIEE